MLIKVSLSELISLTSKMKILYVEDDMYVQDSTQQVLAVFFKSVDTCSNGYEALRQYIDDNYDLVITDINMPHMNGIELIRHIKRIDPLQKLIVISGSIDSATHEQLKNLEIRHCISKPYSFESLVDTFQMCV